jgi:methylthioribose-1-phosphate isomerase
VATPAGKHRTLWLAADGQSLEIIDQRHLPHRFEVATLRSLEDVERAIQSMQVRGAPLIGVTAAYGVCLALRADASDASLMAACERLSGTRPTAVNLRWALTQMRAGLTGLAASARLEAAYRMAAELCEQEAAAARAIGEQGQRIFEELLAGKSGEGPINVLTHCNAGWLATVEWGTALAPVYLAHQRGIDVHVWVDETRPRNQGASLTAWELGQAKVPHTVIADNTGGHLMQHGLVDVCITGSDRTTRRGDVCNKIGTYLKALAAKDNGVPFYAAMPLSTIDWTISDGVSEIPIEQRDPREVTEISGRLPDGAIATVKLTPEGSRALNYGFDVTPARLITGIITELGICKASEEALWAMMPHAQEAAETPPREIVRDAPLGSP